MSDSDFPPDSRPDQWLDDQHRRMVNDLASLLDVEGGLRDAMLPARHADLVAGLGEVLDVEAGLSAIVPDTAPSKPKQLTGIGASKGPVTRRALLIGCSHYEDPAFDPLPTPINDVKALRRVLTNTAIGDFTADDPLLNEPASEVRERIENFFANRKADDLLLLYFSCHGELDDRDRLYFVAADTRKDQLDSTGIPARWVREQMRRSRSRRIVLLLDCCCSGAFPQEILGQLGGRGLVVITASGKTEKFRGSAFTDAVVRGLKTGAADLDGDGEISAYELYQYVYDQLRQNPPDQTPTMSANGLRGQLTLAKNPQEPSPLPVDLETALRSEVTWQRLWAIDGLRRMLDSDHPGGQKRKARQTLLGLRDQGNDPSIRLAAIESLHRVSRPLDIPAPRSRGVRWLAAVCLSMALVVLGAALHMVIGIPGSPASKALPSQPLACSPRVKPADGVLSFGTLLPHTGQFIYSGPALDAGVRLAMKDITDAGPIPGGIVVKLDDANRRDEGNPSEDTGRQSADAMLAGGVDVIIGPSTSPVALKVIDKITCAGVIMFSPANTSPVFTTYPDHGLYFRTAPSSVFESSVLGKLVVDDGNSTAVVMSRDDAFGNPLRELTARVIQQSGGQVLDSFSYDPNSNAREYDKKVERIKAKNPSAIVLIGFAEDAQILTKMIKEGIGPTNKHVYLAGANTTNTLVAQVIPHDPGVLAGLKGTPLDTGGEAFVKRLREVDPGLQDLVYAAQSYDAVVITALAAAIAGTDEPAAVAKEINGVTKDGEECTSFAECMKLVKSGKNIAYRRPSGPLDLTDSGEPSSATYVISEIQADGTVKPLKSVKTSSY